MSVRLNSGPSATAVDGGSSSALLRRELREAAEALGAALVDMAALGGARAGAVAPARVPVAARPARAARHRRTAAVGLWFWGLDRGGPIRRQASDRLPPDFQFPQLENPQLDEPGWHPRVVDYQYLSFTNSIAFSPTDAMPSPVGRSY